MKTQCYGCRRLYQALADVQIEREGLLRKLKELQTAKGAGEPARLLVEPQDDVEEPGCLPPGEADAGL